MFVRVHVCLPLCHSWWEVEGWTFRKKSHRRMKSITSGSQHTRYVPVLLQPHLQTFSQNTSIIFRATCELLPLPPSTPQYKTIYSPISPLHSSPDWGQTVWNGISEYSRGTCPVHSHHCRGQGRQMHDPPIAMVTSHYIHSVCVRVCVRDRQWQAAMADMCSNTAITEKNPNLVFKEIFWVSVSKIKTAHGLDISGILTFMAKSKQC